MQISQRYNVPTVEITNSIKFMLLKKTIKKGVIEKNKISNIKYSVCIID